MPDRFTPDKTYYYGCTSPLSVCSLHAYVCMYLSIYMLASCICDAYIMYEPSLSVCSLHAYVCMYVCMYV